MECNYLCLFDRYESRKGHKGNHTNHQNYRGKKSDHVSSSVTDDKHTNARTNRSNEIAETIAKDIEQASTIRPQGKQNKTKKQLTSILI